MKKMTREERKKWIERGKNVLIVFLCVCCGCLLWSVFNLFRGQLSIGDIFMGMDNGVVSGDKGENDSGNVVKTFWKLSKPETLMIFNDDCRIIVSEVNEYYNEINENINMIMQKAYSLNSEKVLACDEEQWKSAFKGQGAYVKYSGNRDVFFEEQFYGMKDSGLGKKINSYAELLFLPHEEDSKKISVLVRGVKGESYARVEFSAEVEGIKRGIGAFGNSEKGKYFFGFEYGSADKPFGVETDIMLLVPVVNKTASNMTVRMPNEFTSGINFTRATKLTSGMINLFGYNPNTVRQYASGDGALIFVGETGNLSLSPAGKIEYKALGESEGIPLGTLGQGSSSASSVVAGIYQLTEKVFELCGVDGAINAGAMRITEFPVNKETQEIRLKMEYYADGMRVSLGQEPALFAVVKNGVLTELKMWVKQIERKETMVNTEDFETAVASFVQLNPSVKKIISAELIYPYTGDDNESTAGWSFQGEK
ncbi:MAG: hypothetical protein E7412_00305 [Ruminococcaceae bacterium]|nr:hypothetical protein [Oscillospiraceae bacterium]